MNEETHIAENLSIADSACADTLTGKELEIVERVSRKYQELMKVDCTGCEYCMPWGHLNGGCNCGPLLGKPYCAGSAETAF